ncbi:MAG: hypothetical protein AAFY88_05235 [Acidobacteriota bacterium]
MHLTLRICAPLVFLLSLVAFAGPAIGQPALRCDLSSQPGATLLLPYFEVDAADPGGRTTYFAVGSNSTDATVARVVMWTNWGHPVLAFDVGLEPGSVRSFNARDLIAGRLPTTEPPPADDERYRSCASPIRLPNVDPDNLASLLAGEPRVVDGLCYAEPVEDGRLLTGYLTVDIVNNCSGSRGPTPQDSGYFGDCASGLASNENALWGDFFLVDSAGNYAQGEKLVSVPADQTRFGNDVCIDPPCGIRIGSSFWYAEGNRTPLPVAYETRFLRGGDFDGGTELILWTKGQIGPAECGAPEPEGRPRLELVARTERGQPLDSQVIPSPYLTRRLTLGGVDVPMAEGFGRLGIEAEGRQLWVMPLISAEQRFGVGLGATPVADLCF